MKHTKKIIALSIALYSLTTVCFADVPLPHGWYVNGNIGLSNVSNTSYGSGTSVSGDGAGFNIDVGYKFMPFFAGEAGYTKYADNDIKNSAGAKATATNYAIDLAGKGILPLGNIGTELYAKLGVAYVRSHVSNNNALADVTFSTAPGNYNATSWYLGAGAEYACSANFLIDGDWARAHGNSKTGTYDLFSVGLSYLIA